MEKTKSTSFSVRASISKIFSSMLTTFSGSLRKKMKDPITKENKSNTALEHVLNTYTEYSIEDYVIHSKIFLEYDSTDAFMIILKECVLFSYVLEEDINKIKNDPIIIKILFTQIYNFDLIVNQGGVNSVILLYFENNSVSNRTQSKINFFFSKDSFLVHHFLKKNYVLLWQKVYEEKILKDYLSEVYQYHFYVKKINNRGKLQDRILMFSTKVIIFVIFKFF